MVAKEKKKTEYRYSLNLSNDADYIKQFCSNQTNLTDAIRYLIEEEIKKNGIRNLQEYIPAVRPKLDIALVGKGTISAENITTVENEIVEKGNTEIVTEEKRFEKKVPECYQD